jgi:hypothetical protein
VLGAHLGSGILVGGVVGADGHTQVGARPADRVPR